MFARFTPILAALLAPQLSAQTWHVVDFPNGTTIESLAFDPTDSDHVVGLDLDAPTQEVLESYDGGVTWSSYPVPLGIAEFDRATAVTFQHDGRLFLLGAVDNTMGGQALALRRSFGGQWVAGGPKAPLVAVGGFNSVGIRHMVSSASLGFRTFPRVKTELSCS